MKELPGSYSLMHFLDEIEFSEAALSAHADAAVLAPLFQEAIEGWDQVFAIERQGRRHVVRAGAMVSVNDASLDQTFRKFGGVVFLESGQDRTSNFFRRFFKKAPSQLIRWGYRKQCEHTINVVVPEIDKLPEESPLKPFGPQLLRAAEATLTAIDVRAKSRGERDMARHEVNDWKEGINRLRFSVYAELMQIASEKRYSKNWPETFFRSGKASTLDKKKEAPTE